MQPHLTNKIKRLRDDGTLQLVLILDIPGIRRVVGTRLVNELKRVGDA